MMHLKHKFMQFLFESGEENAFNYNRNALNLYFTFDRYSKIVMDATSLIMKKKNTLMHFFLFIQLKYP